MSHSSVFRARRKLLKDSADLQLYDSEFQTDGALTLKAFADNASVIRGIDSNNFISWLQGARWVVVFDEVGQVDWYAGWPCVVMTASL